MLLAIVATSLAAQPAMMTTAKGSVQLNGERVAAPLVLGEGQSLVLAEGASVVLLYGGAATQVKGPTTISLESLQAASASTGEQVAVLDTVLARDAHTQRTGATRAAGELQLQRPVPGDQILAMHTVSWHCEGPCADEAVSIYSFREDTVVWAGSGAGTSIYTGPELAAGPYTLTVAGQEFGFRVASSNEQSTLSGALSAVGTAPGTAELSTADQAALETGLLLHAGYRSDALWALDARLAKQDDPELQAARKALETQAGLAPQ
ncbi:MAG: hypothetical protein ACI9VR_001143 [Cognaticolwellia sp.]